MAVATLEKYNTIEEQKQADELHNSLIRQRYARLINPETKLSEMRTSESAPAQSEAAVQQEVYAPVKEQAKQVYLVENARADSELFRADSYINQKEQVAQPVVAVQLNMIEEENEDLVPTRTTMQYTTEAKRVVGEDGNIANASAKKRLNLTKRDKGIIAVVVSVIVALFVLIIVNSAIISGLNAEMSNLDNTLHSVRSNFEQVNGQVEDYNENFENILKDFAERNGMVKE